MGWRLGGIQRGPGPLLGTVVASASAAALIVAATSIAGAQTTVSAGRLAPASVVVAASTSVSVHAGSADDGPERLPLPAYRGVPATLATQLDRVPGVASATGESGFANGVVRPGDVDLIAVTAKPGVSAALAA